MRKFGGGVNASEQLKQISLSNDTVKSRIVEMSSNIKDKVIMKAKRSPFFAIQLDESTDVQNLSQLLVFIRFIGEGKIEDEFLFCRPLNGTTKGVDVMNSVEDFFKENGLTWDKLAGVCTDGAPAMLGSRSGFISLVKRRNPNVKGVHCIIHKQALASKTLPQNFNWQLQSIIKGSALNTRLFRKLCDTMEAKRCDLLFYTQLRWLSKGNMVKRVFELLEELKTLLKDHGKHDLLADFNEEGFPERLAYLADIFEALNDLKRKMQGKELNIIHHVDAIKGFLGKLSLWKTRIEKGIYTFFSNLFNVVG